MNPNTLPPLTQKKAADYPYFPTRQQLFLWRNWEMLPAEKLAAVLCATCGQVLQLAAESGLPVPPVVNPFYRERGYITLIRNNWHVLPYSQLMELLDLTEDELAFILKEDDFLAEKLGDKPNLPPLHYRPLTAQERQKTAELKKWTLQIPKNAFSQSADFQFLKTYQTPRAELRTQCLPVQLSEEWGIQAEPASKLFAEDFCREMQTRWGISLTGSRFFIKTEILPALDLPRESHIIRIQTTGIQITAVDAAGILRGLQYLLALAEQNGGPCFPKKEFMRKTRFETRFIYSYQALYGDPLLDGGHASYPDSLLCQYARLGINGIWLHVVLYKLVPFPFDASYSKDWERRQEGLRQLIARAARYGIKIYLYFNEPRCMPASFFENHPELLGYLRKNYGTLCTSSPEVRDYLAESIRRLCRAAPGLGGFFTITASENLTNCYSHTVEPLCPRCGKKSITEVFADVNLLFAKAAHSVDPSIEVIAWNWGWQKKGIDWERLTQMLKEENIRLMCTSEEAVEKSFGSVKTAVIDYSISMVGPGAYAKSIWKTAKKHGLKAYAKVQFNNTWECSAVPFIPALQSIENHMEGLIRENVDGLMLSWSLGGYPSLALELMSRYYWTEDAPHHDFYSLFGENGPVVETAAAAFSRAFDAFPFHIKSLYNGPQQMGPANLLFEKPSGLTATMTGYPYDDLEKWRSVFPVELYEEQFRLVAAGFRKALDHFQKAVSGAKNEWLLQFEDTAEACTCIFESCYQQIRFIRMRERYLAESEGPGREALRRELHTLLEQEYRVAQELLEIVLRNGTIGYEAANHYFFNRYSLMEKLLNCRWLQTRF